MGLLGANGPTASPGSASVVSAVSPIVAMLTSTSGSSAAQMIPAWATGKTYLKGDVVLVGASSGSSTATSPCWVCVQSGTTTSSVAGPSGTIPPPSGAINGTYASLGTLSATADTAVWLPLLAFGNGISIANFDTGNTLTIGFDSAITTSSTAAISIGVGGPSLTFNYGGLPASLYALGAAKFCFVGQV